MEQEQRLQDAYDQRNMLAVMMARMALGLGWAAGWALDADKPNWDDEWRVVVYIDLPVGAGVQQISYHVGPLFGAMAKRSLPQYAGKWDGDFAGKRPVQTLTEFFNVNERCTVNLTLDNFKNELAARSSESRPQLQMTATEYMRDMVPGQVAADSATKVSDDVEAQVIDDLIQVAREAENLVDHLNGMGNGEAPGVDYGKVRNVEDALAAFNPLPDPPRMPNATWSLKAEHALRYATDDLRTARGIIQERNETVDHAINLQTATYASALAGLRELAAREAGVCDEKYTGVQRFDGTHEVRIDPTKEQMAEFKAEFSTAQFDGSHEAGVCVGTFLEPVAGVPVAAPVSGIEHGAMGIPEKMGSDFSETANPAPAVQEMGVCVCHGGGARCYYKDGAPKCEWVDTAKITKLEGK